MRLACLDFLTLQTDRHPANLFYDKKKKCFSGIDNGFANGLTKKDKIPAGEDQMEMDLPVNQYTSVPMQLINNIPKEWQLDQAALDQLKGLFENIKNHLRYSEGLMEPAEADSLPDHVKQGRDAKIISDGYRLLHERRNEQGEVIPETTLIAKKEAQAFLERLNYLLIHKRFPRLNTWQIRTFQMNV